jgi:hypothetical protein
MIGNDIELVRYFGGLYIDRSFLIILQKHYPHHNAGDDSHEQQDQEDPDPETPK